MMGMQRQRGRQVGNRLCREPSTKKQKPKRKEKKQKKGAQKKGAQNEGGAEKMQKKRARACIYEKLFVFLCPIWNNTEKSTYESNT